MAEYDEPTRSCRLRTSVSQGGMLSQFLERISSGTLDTKNMRCDLCAARKGVDVYPLTVAASLKVRDSRSTGSESP